MTAPAPAPPRNEAVALRYSAQALAPRIVAKGEGAVAEAIRSRAEAAGVPVREMPALLPLLLQLDLDALIPPALYAVVAEVLAWAYRVDERSRDDSGRPLPPPGSPDAGAGASNPSSPARASSATGATSATGPTSPTRPSRASAATRAAAKLP